MPSKFCACTYFVVPNPAYLSIDTCHDIPLRLLPNFTNSTITAVRKLDHVCYQQTRDTYACTYA